MGFRRNAAVTQRRMLLVEDLMVLCILRTQYSAATNKAIYRVKDCARDWTIDEEHDAVPSNSFNHCLYLDFILDERFGLSDDACFISWSSYIPSIAKCRIQAKDDVF